jgi:hypothetical protein
VYLQQASWAVVNGQKKLKEHMQCLAVTSLYAIGEDPTEFSMTGKACSKQGSGPGKKRLPDIIIAISKRNYYTLDEAIYFYIKIKILVILRLRLATEEKEIYRSSFSQAKLSRRCAPRLPQPTTGSLTPLMASQTMVTLLESLVPGLAVFPLASSSTTSLIVLSVFRCVYSLSYPVFDNHNCNM